MKLPSVVSKVLAGFLNHIQTSYADPLPEMLDLIKCLRAEGILVGLLTNNWLLDKENTFMPLDRSLFDEVHNWDACTSGGFGISASCIINTIYFLLVFQFLV